MLKSVLPAVLICLMTSSALAGPLDALVGRYEDRLANCAIPDPADVTNGAGMLISESEGTTYIGEADHAAEGGDCIVYSAVKKGDTYAIRGLCHFEALDRSPEDLTIKIRGGAATVTHAGQAPYTYYRCAE